MIFVKKIFVDEIARNLLYYRHEDAQIKEEVFLVTVLLEEK